MTETSTSTVNNVAVKPQQANKSGKWIVILLILITLSLCCGLTALSIYALSTISGDSSFSVDANPSYETVSGSESSQDKILAISIKGPILNEGAADSSSLFATSSYVYGYTIKQQLQDAASDKSIKAVMLEIDSPGGTITGSKAISDGVAYYKEQTNNPVYAHIMGTGASGGYWSAASADKIYSDYSSLVGSIGVIFGPFKYYKNVTSELSGLEAITTTGGIETYYITAGGNKDFGNPYRKMSSEEEKNLQDDTDSAYDMFVKHVSTARNISENKIRNEIQAMPYGEEQALKLGLIDAIGAKNDAYADLASNAGLGDDYKVITVKSDTDFWSLLMSGKLLSNNSAKAETNLYNELSGKMLYFFGSPESLK